MVYLKRESIPPKSTILTEGGFAVKKSQYAEDRFPMLIIIGGPILIIIAHLFFVQFLLFKDKIEQIIKVAEKVVPKMITGVNNVALGSIKNFWGPADNKHISPTMMEDI